MALAVKTALILKLREQAMAAGLTCHPVDGVNGDIVILASPYHAKDGALQEIVGKTAGVIKAVLRAEGCGWLWRRGGEVRWCAEAAPCFGGLGIRGKPVGGTVDGVNGDIVILASP